MITHRELPQDPSVTRVDGDAVGYVRSLKQHAQGDIWLCGGADLAGQLIDLIDEIQVKVNPVLFGEGLPLAATTYLPRGVDLARVEELPGGVVLLTYRRREPAALYPQLWTGRGGRCRERQEARGRFADLLIAATAHAVGLDL